MMYCENVSFSDELYKQDSFTYQLLRSEFFPPPIDP